MNHPDFMPRTHWRVASAFTAISMLGSTLAPYAAPPTWWGDRGVIVQGATESNYSVANIGQAKWMVSQALAELNTIAPYLAAKIDLNKIFPTAPGITDSAWYEAQKAALTIGQLKAIAHQFYSELPRSWIDQQASLNQITLSGGLPWDPNTPVADNLKLVNIGQLKAVFSLRFSQDSDSDTLPDIAEHVVVESDARDAISSIQSVSQADDFDGDGVSNGDEIISGWNPASIYSGGANVAWPESSITAHYRTDKDDVINTNGSVTSWNSSVGESLPLTATNGNPNLIDGGVPVVRAGQDQRMTLNVGGTDLLTPSADGFTILGTFKTAELTTNIYGGILNNEQYLVSGFRFGKQGTKMGWWTTQSGGDVSLKSVEDITSDTDYQFTLSYSEQSTAQLRLNGELQEIAQNSTIVGNTINIKTQFLSYPAHTGQAGDWGELIIAHKDLTTAERTLLEDYLLAKHQGIGPLAGDVSGSGIPDWQDVDGVGLSGLRNTDSDGDGVSDWDEAQQGTHTTINIDADNNNIPDDWEKFWGKQFSAYPQQLTAELFTQETQVQKIYLNNPLDSDATFSVVLEGGVHADTTNYTSEDSLTGSAVYQWNDIAKADNMLIGSKAALFDNNQNVPYVDNIKVSLGMPFPFYGKSYSEMHIDSNGLLQFGANNPKASFSNYSGAEYVAYKKNVAIPTADIHVNNFIAPFWADHYNGFSPPYIPFGETLQDGEYFSSIYYKAEPGRVIVSYNYVNAREAQDENYDLVPFAHLSNNPTPGGWSTKSYQVVLHADGKIDFFYRSGFTGGLQIASSVGIENENGTKGLQLMHNQTPTSTQQYIKNGMAIRISPKPTTFVTVTPATGSVAAGQISELDVSFNSSDLPPGTYTASIQVDQTGVESSSWSIPVTLEVVNNPPTISITSLHDGGNVVSSPIPTIQVSAEDDSGIEKVEFYSGETKLGEDTQSPYTHSWSTITEGSHTLIAIATDTFGIETASAPVTIQVQSDTDADGLGDTWEMSHFGNLDQDGTVASDNDQYTDIEEFELGYDPHSYNDDDGDLGDPGDPSDPEDQSDNPEPLIVTGDGVKDFEVTGTKTYTLPAGGGSYLVTSYVHSEEYPQYTEQQSQYDDILRWSIKPDGGEEIASSVSVNTLHQQWQESEQKETSYLGYSPVALKVLGVVKSLPDSTCSVEVEIGVTNVSDGSLPSSAIVALLPVEVAPEVLAVNSDFDEGRIDPDTGYAIPDCDDVKDVDVKTGAGNGELRIDTEREHLDGLYANDERVTDDMHKGWFGVNPTQLDDDFWDSATVTISKLDKIDPDTGRKESGQVRFYAKWGDPKFGTYYGIIPYDLQTLAPNNLVTSGVNGKPGEGVYGSSSTIPDDAEFWMEGVRPGKITLEWRLQKGDIDVKYEQTFLVRTEKSKAEWLEQLTYMIRLQTDDDPEGTSLIFGEGYQYGGQENVSASPTAAAGYASNVDRASEYYDFYEQCWNQNNSLSWSGLAKVVGAQVISGISDSQWGIVGQLGFVNVSGWLAGYDLADIKAFQLELFKGGEAIFKDVGWQHHAYLASGICALEFVHENQAAGPTPDVSEDVLEGWKLIDDGDATGDASKILNGSIRIADYEQNTVIVETYTNLDAIGGGGLVNAMSALAVNPVQGGDHFRDVAGLGTQLSNTGERWEWVTAGLPGFGHAGKKGVLKAWDSLTQAQKDGFANEDLRVGARRFSVPWILTTVESPYLPNLDVQVWDHLDQPGKQ